MSDLKPCPFCGSDQLYYNSASGAKPGRFVRCADCDARGPLDKDDALARAAWSKARRGENSVLLPVDAEGVPIRLGDVLYSEADGASLEVRSIELDCYGFWALRSKACAELPYWTPEGLTHEKPVTWESIKAGIYHLVMAEYLDDPEEDVNAIMERIKKLKEGE